MGPRVALGRLRGKLGLGYPGAELLVRRCPRVAPRRIVALSFDDGPAEHTEAVADLLDEHAARATFFLVGEHLRGREHVVARLVAAGHELGNHLWSHRRAAELSDEDLREEICRTSEAIASLAGAPPSLLRPPFFSAAERSARLAHEQGILRTALGVVGYDWEHTKPEPIVAALLERLRPGEILVLHDGVGRGASGHSDRSVTVAAVARLLPALRERGYEAVTVSELLAASQESR
ncbi:MAG TPA: polysaccharide deacetylase family protein [Gaiellaceae bacterium]|nr:polysaccharide deacetylase family protein [Gaiellaceae bacterium]